MLSKALDAALASARTLALPFALALASVIDPFLCCLACDIAVFTRIFRNNTRQTCDITNKTRQKRAMKQVLFEQMKNRRLRHLETSFLSARTTLSTL